VSNIGRFSSGHIIGVKKDSKFKIELMKQCHTHCILKIDAQLESFVIGFVYLPPKSDCTLNELLEDIASNGEKIICMGDFNARIGNVNPLSSIFSERKSQDNIISDRGIVLMDFVEQNVISVLNRCSKSDSSGDLTFVNKNGCSVIDICLASNTIQSELDLKVLNYDDSCHFPILLSINPTSDNFVCTRVQIIKFEVEKSQDFRIKLNDLINKNNPCNLNEICEMVIDSSDHCGMVKTKILSNKPSVYGPKWLDNDCIKLKQKMQFSLRKFRTAKSVNIKNNSRLNYCNDKIKYQSIITAKKQII
jgi:retrotransposon-encoded endonuclease